MKVIIAGGRSFCSEEHYKTLKLVCSELLSNYSDITIVSGTASGADSLGERFATENNYELVKFPADWKRHGKSAGYIRNTEMAEYADMLIAFWDGSSKGTNHMLNIATNKKLIVNVTLY